jgi:ribosomal protein S18 acetylase RimI-like enzyme
MNAFEVRPFSPFDHDAVLQCFRSNVPTHFEAGEESWLINCIGNPHPWGPNFVAVETATQRVVGFGGYEIAEHYNRAVLVFGHVHADFHGRGIGKQLLQTRLDHIRQHAIGTDFVVVDTTPHIAPFYARHGFEITTTWAKGYRSGFDKIDLRYVVKR